MRRTILVRTIILVCVAVVFIIALVTPSPALWGPPTYLTANPTPCGIPPLERCGSYTGILVTPPATPDPPVLLNQHPDAQIQVFDAGDGLHYWIPTPDGTRYFVCHTSTVRSMAEWYSTSPNRFEACGGPHNESRTFFTVRYWNPEQVIIVFAYSYDIATLHLTPYSITIDIDNNVYRNDQ